jgi:Uma2 family endonuclease
VFQSPKRVQLGILHAFFSDQGYLSESEYLRLTDHTRRVAEFIDGQIEVLPMPTLEHQEIVLFLITLLRAFILPAKLGRAVMSPYRVKVGENHFREPDVVFLRESSLSRLGNRFSEGADLVMEVVSDDDPKRDLVDKRHDYAEAGIPEYWIVDPRTQMITVLRLESREYVVHSEATFTGQVRSAMLDGFTVDVAGVFAAGRNA